MKVKKYQKPSGPIAAELIPSQAIKYNNSADNAAFMIPYGGTPDNPEFLYPEELHPATVTADKSVSEQKKIDRQVSEMMSGNDWLYHSIGGGKSEHPASAHGRKYVQPLVNAATMGIGAPMILTNPATLAVGKSIYNFYNQPGIKQLVDTYWTYKGIKNLTSENGIQKTYNHFKNEEYWNGTKSLIGDVIDLLGAKFLWDDYVKISKKGAEVIARMGDAAAQPSKLKKQLFNKNTFKYVFDNNADPNLAYQLPYKYSGESATAANAHYGDVIDQFFRKVPVDDANLEDLPKEIQNYLNTNYKGKKVGYKDLGTGYSSTNATNPYAYDVYYVPELNGYNIKGFKDGKYIKVNGREPGYNIASPEVWDDSYKLMLDPGGHNVYIGRQGNDFVADSYDIWKFKPSEFTKRYTSGRTGFSDWTHQQLKKLGLKWLDSQGSPIVYKWNTKTKNFYLPMDE